MAATALMMAKKFLVRAISGLFEVICWIRIPSGKMHIEIKKIIVVLNLTAMQRVGS